MSPPFVVQFASFGKGIGRGVVDFSSFDQAVSIESPSDENAAISQKGGRMGRSGSDHPFCRREFPGIRIENTRVTLSIGREHISCRKYRGRHTPSQFEHVGQDCESSGLRFVNLRWIEIGTFDENSTILQQDCFVLCAGL